MTKTTKGALIGVILLLGLAAVSHAAVADLKPIIIENHQAA